MIFRHIKTGNRYRPLSLNEYCGRFVQIDDNGNDIYEERDFITYKGMMLATYIIRIQNLLEEN